MINTRSIKLYIPVFILVLALGACNDDLDSNLDAELEGILTQVAQQQGATDQSYYILPDSDDYASIPQDPLNPITKEKVDLGQLLYHETALGTAPEQMIGIQSYSCASCHFASAGFQAGIAQGIGEGGIGFGNNGERRIVSNQYDVEDVDVQPIRTPATLHTAFQTNMLWNGQFGATGVNVGTEAQWTAGTPKAVNHLGFEGIEIQAIAGSGVHRLDCDMALVEELNYTEMFDAAFPDLQAPERYEIEQAGLAIAAYERTLMANNSPFQEWLKGNTAAMTSEEKRGAIIFFGKGQCATCHSNPALSSMEFHAIGMNDLHESHSPSIKTSPDNPENLGRGGFTMDPADNYKFKVPQLYNLDDSNFYGHGSSFYSVKDVVRYKNRAISQNAVVPESALSGAFVPLNLTDQEIDELTLFLEKSLHDPNLDRYEPSAVLSGNCIPNNDFISRMDGGCE